MVVKHTYHFKKKSKQSKTKKAMKKETLFQKTFDVLEATNTNFQVEKLPLITACGKSTGSFGNFRSDNGKWLGTFKESYQIYQNHELVELLLDATESLNLEVSNGGSFKEGARVYYQIALPDEYIGKSSVKRSITAINSHDGSTAIALGSTNVVVACSNKFFKAHKELEKVKHTSNSRDKVQVMAMNLKQTIEKDILMMDNFKRMADLNLKDEMVERMIKKLFKADLNKNQDEVSTRTKNNIKTFADNLNTEINLEGKTLWGLFNAVTRYTNHEASPSDEIKKVEYLMNGTGFKLSNLAFDECMNWIESNSHQFVMIER